MKLLYYVIGLTIVVLDRITKYWALQLTGYYSITDWFACATSYNYGISWGLFQTQTTIQNIMLTGIIVSVIALVGWYGKQYARETITCVAVTCIIAGALSNVFDRCVYGGVIDFIELSYRGFVWPSFNVADSAIVLGVALLIFHDITTYKGSR